MILKVTSGTKSKRKGVLISSEKKAVSNSIPVLIYARASTNDQESGIATQLAIVTKKIELLGYRTISQTYTDEGISGDILPEERPAFQELLNFIKTFQNMNLDKSIQEVWVQSRDRISRDVDHLGYTIVKMRKLGVELHSTEGDDSDFKNRFYDLLAEEELKRYRLKSAQGIQRRLTEKKVMSRPPYGYTISSEGKLVVDEKLRLRIIEIFDLFEQGLSNSKISFHYNIPISSLSYMRRNRIYTTGEYLFRGKVVYTVEPIIKIQECDSN